MELVWGLSAICISYTYLEDFIISINIYNLLKSSSMVLMTQLDIKQYIALDKNILELFQNKFLKSVDRFLKP